MSWICNLFQVLVQLMILVIASAENGTITMSTATTTTSSTTTTTATMTATTPTIVLSPETSQTTPEQNTVTLTSVTIGLLISLVMVGFLALIFLFFLLLRVLYLKLRKPEENVIDPKRDSVRLSVYRMSTGPDFLVSPIEIFCLNEEVSSSEKENSTMIAMNGLQSQNVQKSSEVPVVETESDHVDDNKEYNEAATLPMEDKRGKDTLEQNILYVNGMLPTGRKMSNPATPSSEEMTNIKMPTLPQRSLETRAKAEELTESNPYAIPFEQFNTPYLASDPDPAGEEYAYADLPQDRSEHESDDNSVQSDYTYPEFPLINKMNEDEYASVHSGSDDDNHLYNEPTEMTEGITRQPTTNHYKNNQKVTGRKGHIKGNQMR